MQQLITSEEAKRITGGRTPLVPVEYETAVRALAECISLDDAKYWSEKADALAAWAKIYHSDQVSRQAKQLKLHAFRRIGALSEELRPTRAGAQKGRYGGRAPGARSLLKEKGFSNAEATAVLRIAKLPILEYQEIVGRKNPPTPYTAVKPIVNGSGAYNIFATTSGGPVSMRSFCRRFAPDTLAEEMSKDEKKRALEIAVEIDEWLDTFMHVIELR